MIRTGMCDAAAAVIDELLAKAELDRPSEQQLAMLLQSGGAVLRQLRKRFESDELSNLTTPLVALAYRNEFARVVRTWPESGEIIAPAPFFTAVQLLRRAFARHGWIEAPPPLPPGFLPTDLDACPCHIVVNGAKCLHASATALQLLDENASVLLSGDFDAQLLVAESSLSEFKRDMQSIALGGCVVSKPYWSALTDVARIVVLHAESVYDDDGELLGDLIIFDDASAHESGNGYRPYTRVTVLSQPPQLSMAL